MFHSIVRFSFASIHTPICIIGGGSAGLNASSQLSRMRGVLRSQIRIFEPSRIHHYQPAWTMVAGGFCDPKSTQQSNEETFREGILLTYLKVSSVDPKINTISTEDGQTWTYDHLIVAAGNVCDFDGIKGLKESLDDPNIPVGSAYWRDYAVKFSRLVDQTKSGRAIFTEPPMPIKCGGAPQKVLYLSEERFRKSDARKNIEIVFHKTIGVMFGVPKYSESLLKIAAQKNINVNFKSKLVEVKGKDQIAVFENQDTKELTSVKFDLLHAVPSQYPPKFIAQSGLGDATGYCDVDKLTLQHKTFKNVWSLGDCSSLPTSKTAAAVMSQTPVLIDNLYQVWKNKTSSSSLPEKYDGYSSCPIFVGDNKLLLAEFKYDGVIDETFSSRQDTPYTAFFLMKKYFFPFAYWHLMSKGIWYGRQGTLPVITRFFKIQ